MLEGDIFRRKIGFTGFINLDAQAIGTVTSGCLIVRTDTNSCHVLTGMDLIGLVGPVAGIFALVEGECTHVDLVLLEAIITVTNPQEDVIRSLGKDAL